jgi:hypothetical protein
MYSTYPALRAPAAPRRPATIVLSIKPIAEVWLVREAESSSGEVYDRREDALARARHLLRRRGGGRLKIYTRDGFIERELELQRAR